MQTSSLGIWMIWKDHKCSEELHWKTVISNLFSFQVIQSVYMCNVEHIVTSKCDVNNCHNDSVDNETIRAPTSLCLFDPSLLTSFNQDDGNHWWVCKESMHHDDLRLQAGRLHELNRYPTTVHLYNYMQLQTLRKQPSCRTCHCRNVFSPKSQI